MRLTVDGQSFGIDADPDMPLLWALTGKRIRTPPLSKTMAFAGRSSSSC